MNHTITRMAQITPTTTTHYPSKFYSIDYAGGSTTTATSTAYLWHGDTPVAYIEQVIADGAATGTPSVYYVHPDHLGSTNVVTDENGEVVEALDYYPYGEERIHSGSADADRTFIGQFGDDASSLSYLNARYYDGNRGQFVSQDPVFWEIGQTQDGRAVLSDPQLQNSYSWARNNPITLKDPNGRCPICVPIAIGGGIGFVGGVGTQAFNDYLTGDFGNRSFSENLSAYSVAGIGGATVGAGTVAAGIAAPFVGVTGVGATVAAGGAAGTLTGVTSLAGDRILGQQTDFGALGVSVGVSALSAGTLQTLPKVVGRWPSLGTKAFYSGQHTQRFGAEEFVSGSMQSFGQTAYRTSQSFSYSGAVSQLQSIVSQLQSIVKSLSASQDKKDRK